MPVIITGPEFSRDMYVMYLYDARNAKQSLDKRIYWMKMAIRYKRLYNEAVASRDA